ncbi:unnamed protein product, partial [Polarella glacialis]
TGGRLWALLSSGELEAWDLFGSRSLGRWRPDWHEITGSVGFKPTYICEDEFLGMLVLGRSHNEGAVLARATSPSNLAAEWSRNRSQVSTSSSLRLR